MPADVATYLARTYLNDLRELSGRLGGYASFWLYCAERLVDGPPETEAIDYPLYQSSLWREWMGVKMETPKNLRSGPLSSIGFV
jgi:hypothetical protein